MADLIDRQQAIDAICKACSLTSDYHKCDGYPEESTWCEELVALRALPSAQSEIIRCKDCRHRIVNDHYGERGYLKIKGYCELDTGDPFELGRNAENDDWFCADAERRTDVYLLPELRSKDGWR